MSKRLTRKEIKHDIREDEVRSVLSHVFEYLQEHPKVVGGAVAGFLAAVLGLTGLLAYLDNRGEAANEELAEAIKIYGAQVVADGAEPEDPDAPTFASEEERRTRAKEVFTEVSGGIGASVAGEVAELFLADIALEEGDPETARSIWEKFLKGNEDHLLALQVRLNLLRLDRENGRADEVEEALRRELDSDSKTLPEDVILFELAKTLDFLNRSEEALELYQQILDEHPTSPYSSAARQITTSTS